MTLLGVAPFASSRTLTLASIDSVNLEIGSSGSIFSISCTISAITHVSVTQPSPSMPYRPNSGFQTCLTK